LRALLFYAPRLLFGFVYWQTAVYLMDKNDALLSEHFVFSLPTHRKQRLQEIDDRLRKDPERIKIAGLFDHDGHRIAG